LYYAPAIFAYLLGFCLDSRIQFFRLVNIGIVTIIAFAVLVLPIYLGALYDSYRGVDARPELEGQAASLPIFDNWSYMFDATAWYFPLVQQTAQLLYRIFPFSRGLFEDKVANFWCTLNIVVKLKLYGLERLQRAALFATLGAITPPCLVIFLKPRKELLPLAFASTAWGFFLFSFQVHEKSVLLPLLPMTVLLAGNDGLGKESRAWVGFANMLGAWTLFPLLQRVDLRVPYFVLALLWAYLLGLPPMSLNLYAGDMLKSWHGLGTAAVHLTFYSAMIAWHIVEVFIVPPTSLPDLWVVVNVGIGAVGFSICYIWCLLCLILESGLFAAGRAERRVASANHKRKTR